jgi:hypothetical protein
MINRAEIGSAEIGGTTIEVGPPGFVAGTGGFAPRACAQAGSAVSNKPAPTVTRLNTATARKRRCAFLLGELSTWREFMEAT